jgi:hypothetical protein
MRHSVEQLGGTENDWAEKLRKEAESWHRRKRVPTAAHKGVRIVRVGKRKPSVSGPALIKAQTATNGQA